MENFLFRLLRRRLRRRLRQIHQIHQMRYPFLLELRDLQSHLQLKILEKHLKLIQRYRFRYRDHQFLLHQLLLDNLVLKLLQHNRPQLGLLCSSLLLHLEIL